MNGSFMQIINGQNSTYYDIFHIRLLIEQNQNNKLLLNNRMSIRS